MESVAAEIPLSTELLQQVSDALARQTGLRFPPERWPELTRGIAAAARELHFPDGLALAQWAVSAPLRSAAADTLISHLTVGETYFFRHQECFQALETLLSKLIQERSGNERRLRIWSAGCCTGEEPYSVAILLRGILAVPTSSWNITILGTDVNRKFLQKAQEAVYTEWSFRQTPPLVRQAAFRSSDAKRFELREDVKNMVTFSWLNLAQDIYPSLVNDTNAMDIILCRNVLMYFSPEQATETLRRFRHCLVTGGWLFLGPNETPDGGIAGLVTRNVGGITAYCKEGAPVPHTTPPESSAPVRPPACLPVRLPAPVVERREPPPDSARLAQLARCEANEGRLDAALAWCDRAVALEKLNPEFHFLRAVILQESGRIQEATTVLRTVLFLDPNYAVAHFTLGNLERRLGKPEDSQRHYANALTILRRRSSGEALPESDGMTAGQLIEMIQAAQGDG